MSTWLDLGGNELFADAAYLMIPTYWWGRETKDFLLHIYGDYLAEVYVTVAKNECWRRPLQAAGRLIQIRLIYDQPRSRREKITSVEPLNRAGLPSLAGRPEWP